ncbi:PHP domain-containing protein [Nanoarchaeota archaeon]
MSSVFFKRPPLKKLAKEGFFGVDFHFHTRFSLDGISRIRSAVKKAEKKGFGFAITDHNTIKGVIASYKQREHTVIIPGIEITCRNGNHLLMYFYNHRELEEFFDKKLKPRMKNNPFFIDISAEELSYITKDYNCHMAAPHPFAPGAVGIKHTGVSTALEKKFDMIEVINGYNFRKSNMEAVLWATKAKKGMTGGSDGHSTYELGKVLTFTHGNDIESIFKDILKRDSVVIGKEDNLFLKAVMSIRKESAYVNRSKKQHMAKTLIRSQLGTEYKYLKEKFKHGRAYHMLTRHHEEIVKQKTK